MFNGIINNLGYLIFNKYFLINNYFFYFFIIKINFLNYLNINIGFSFSLSGICLTLIYKSLNFLEFELSFETLLFFYYSLKLLNLENSILLFNNINGNLLYGHLNSSLKIKYILIFNKFLKFCFFINKKNKIFILYKYSIFINGISLTINEINFWKKFYFCLNIINFTFNLTNLKFIKIFDFLNLEFDLTIFFILNFLFFKCI